MTAVAAFFAVLFLADDILARRRNRQGRRTLAAAIQPAEQAKARARLLRWCGTQHIGGPRP